MNLPNKLTMSRIILTVFFVVALFAEFPFHMTVALAIFIGASLTDYFDGKIARERQLITDFGKLMDPLADKMLICSAFIAFVELGHISSWMVIIIVARELAITGLRLLAASKNVVLAAEGAGKHKTISQITCVIGILVELSYTQWGELAERVFEIWLSDFTSICKWAAVFFTVYSGWMYLWKNRDYFLEDK
ncbi:CDP-diacylglycerol--glycerol-3-phosphate 3-phosphatidyltransferase [Verrucomicrobia bacterium]|nr:CDP-diacylglycerol--glycerol-3-phosphate 3-phosphatidyltransferase [Verrucomicrobiota bacterium]